MSREATCKQRWAAHKNSRVSDLRRLLKAACMGEESAYARRVRDDLGEMYEYGLGFDYVEPGTFTGQREGYWRYQISWGGPSEEFRFYASGPHAEPYRITFCFMDWFDGYNRKLRGKDEQTLIEYWWDFEGMGLTDFKDDTRRDW